MAKFCTECGKEIADGVAFCTECGAKAPADPASKVVSTGTFFGTTLLFALPFIGFIACIIMCFAPKRKSLKNYAKANLIWAIIGLVFSILLVVAVIALGGSLMDYLSEAMGGGLGDLSGMQ